MLVSLVSSNINSFGNKISQKPKWKNYRFRWLFYKIVQKLILFYKSHKSSQNQPIETTGPPSLRINTSKSIVAKFVHQTIQLKNQEMCENMIKISTNHCRRSITVNSKLAISRVVVIFFDVMTFGRRPANSDHPKEFVDVVRWIALWESI